jgi:hypothetical protein
MKTLIGIAAAIMFGSLVMFGSLALTRATGLTCNAPPLICKAAANQDRSLYVRDHSRYQQKIHIERFKLKDNDSEKTEEVRDTTAEIEPSTKPDKTGEYPVEVRVISDTDKNGNPKRNVDQGEKTFLSFGGVMDLAFFPLLPEKIEYYDFKDVPAERKGEKWYRFSPKFDATQVPLASGIVELDPDTGEVLTIKIDGLHNLDRIDKLAHKVRSFQATIDYSQFEGALRMPTLANGNGVSEVPKFTGNFRFHFQEGKYVLVSKIQ